MVLQVYTTGLETSTPPTGDLRILSVFPNPMNSSTFVMYALPESSNLRLDVFDIAGRKVRSIEMGTVPEGENSVSWDGRSETGEALSSGIYFLHLTGDGILSDAKRVVLVR